MVDKGKKVLEKEHKSNADDKQLTILPDLMQASLLPKL